MSDNRKTAADLIAELASNPKHQEMRLRKEEDLNLFWKTKNDAALPIVEALRDVGMKLDVVADLLDGRTLDPDVAPILLKHVKQTEYPDEIREILLRALASPIARPYWHELISLFQQNSAQLSPAIRYVAAVAIDGAFSEDNIDDVLRLARDRHLGIARAPLLLTLGRSTDPRARMLLLELRDDPDLSKEIKRIRRVNRGNRLTKND